MKVLICASEGSPYIKTGGLADVIGALPIALKKEGVDVRVMLPYYQKIKEKVNATYIGYCYVRISDRNEYVGVFHQKAGDIDYYFLDSERYFGRPDLYGYGDDGERFSYFDFAVLEALKVINFMPDILHLNDWQTGLIPYILKNNYNYYEEYRRIKTVYSIHNIKYQGIFPKDLMSILFMPYSSSLEFNNCINFMKCAIVESNIITTVSPTYKWEVLTGEYGEGLEYMLELRKYDFYGIINGIDDEKYNPATDPNIFYHYDSKNMEEGKLENKKGLLKEFGLPYKDVPVFGLVSRLVDQKGIDILMPILEHVINNTEAYFILMGSGDKVYEDYFRYMESKYPDRFKSYVGYSDNVAQKIYAGSDIFLMPSKFEPCGLGQMIAMRYGTLPLVRETGGLKDTVMPYNKYENTGTGFTFTYYNCPSLEEVMFIANATYYDKEAFKNLRTRAMAQDFSWNNSAKEYIKLYEKLMY